MPGGPAADRSLKGGTPRGSFIRCPTGDAMVSKMRVNIDTWSIRDDDD